MINENVPIPLCNRMGNVYKIVELFRFKYEVVQLLIVTDNNTSNANKL